MTSVTQVVRFEVCGKVQGVFFRKYTKKMCDKLGIKGWVLNTRHGTVQGCLEGTHSAVDSMKTWLQSEGSPKSRIDKCTFYEETLEKAHARFSIILDAARIEELTFKT